MEFRKEQQAENIEIKKMFIWITNAEKQQKYKKH